MIKIVERDTVIDTQATTSTTPTNPDFGAGGIYGAQQQIPEKRFNKRSGAQNGFCEIDFLWSRIYIEA
jgi:hypothetical protein